MRVSLNIPIIALIILSFGLFSSKAISSKRGIPSKIRVVWRSNTSHSASILWDTGKRGPVDEHMIYFDTVDHGLDKAGYKFQASPLKITKYKNMYNALARLDQLKADTKYYFLLENRDGLSRRFWFKTAPQLSDKKISFIAGGDSRNNRTARRNANTLVSKLKSLFVLFGGDMTDNGTRRQWMDWFDDWQLTISKSGRVTPIIVARGNHERNNRLLEILFDMPARGYYALSIAQKLLKVYVLNSEISIGGDQTSWLLKELSDNHQYYFSTAIYHRPMRPHVTSKREGVKLYKNWALPFHFYQMDLAIESDSHTVKSTYPIAPTKKVSGESDEGFVRNDLTGTVFVGEGCWGAPIRKENDRKKWTRSAGSFNQFKLVFVNSLKMEVRTIKTGNAVDVPELLDENPFLLPGELQVWEPKTGAVITIPRKAGKGEGLGKS